MTPNPAQRMGVPVSGKNIFPSNIQGLPTWFTVRVSKDGYIARREDYHILVAMNRDTIAEDVRKLPPGGVCLYPQEWKLREDRPDIVYYPMPVEKLIDASDVPANLKLLGEILAPEYRFLVATSGAVSLVPHTLARASLPGVALRPISGPRVESSYSIVWNPANRLQVLPQVLEVFGVRAARRQPSGARVMALGASSTSK